MGITSLVEGVPGLLGKATPGLDTREAVQWKCLTCSLQFPRQCSDQGEIPMADKGSANIEQI